MRLPLRRFAARHVAALLLTAAQVAGLPHPAATAAD